MFKSKKFQYLIPVSIIFALAIIIFALGCVYDKPFAESIYNHNHLKMSVFSTAFCLIGPLVTNFFGAFSSVALFLTAKRQSKFWTVILTIYAVCGFVMTSYFAYTSSTEFITYIRTDNEILKASLDYITFSIILIMDAIVGYFTYKKVKTLDKEKVFWTALMMLLIIGLIAILGEVIKYLASRPRPRLIFSDSTYEFKEWYQWNPLYGFKVKECKSFISGHSNNGAAVITLLPLFLSLTKLSEKKYFIPVTVSIGGLYWAIIVLSRLFALAHFLTDVAGACIVSIVFQILILFVVEKIKNKTEAKASVSN